MSFPLMVSIFIGGLFGWYFADSEWTTCLVLAAIWFVHLSARHSDEEGR